MLTTGDIYTAVKILRDSPQGARDLLQHPSIIQNLKALHPTPPQPPSWALETFGRVPQWALSKALILHGPSGLGKSSLAKALLPMALFCSHTDQLKQYDPQKMYGIIFDDMNFLHWPRESQIHLVDWDFMRSIHLRYVNASIPAHTPKIFTTNLLPLGMINAADPAVARRTTAWHVTGRPGHLSYHVDY